jgi:hypothetical protein
MKMTTVSHEQATEYAPHRFSAEASELGLKPGQAYPEFISTEMGNGLDFLPFRIDAQGDRVYRQNFGCIELTVLDD